jgi:hypothetical protein
MAAATDNVAAAVGDSALTAKVKAAPRRALDCAQRKSASTPKTPQSRYRDPLTAPRRKIAPRKSPAALRA